MADKKIKKKFSNHSGEEQEVNEQFHVRPILWNQPQSNLRLKCLELSTFSQNQQQLCQASKDNTES